MTMKVSTDAAKPNGMLATANKASASWENRRSVISVRSKARSRQRNAMASARMGKS